MALMVVFALATAFLVVRQLYFTGLITAAILLLLAASIYAGQQKVIRRMEQLISNIRYGDLNITFPVAAKGTEGELARSMNEALASFRQRLYNSVAAETENEAWQKLIRVLTHEIMNSMAPIISLSETLTERAGQNGMNARDYDIMLRSIQTIHRRSRGLLDFVNNYRQLTKLPVPVTSPFPVAELFNGLRGLFAAEEACITCSVIPPDLYLIADRSLMEQVLVNLLKNAVEASAGSAAPEIRIEAFRRDGLPVITVSDKGSGIAPEAMDKVFVPFFTTKPGGSGIGLSICRQIMNRHGGSIAVSSTAGNTVFTLQFGR
jgi:signal transduction histidine kinase